VTPLARLVIGDRKLALGLERLGDVRHVGDVGVAVRAAQLAAMHRALEHAAVDVEALDLAARQGDRHRLVTVAGQAGLDVLVLWLRGNGRGDPHGDDQGKQE
jgi:hypothetical protein